MSELRYQFGDPRQSLILSASTLDALDQYKQTRWYHREAGGQLFARIEDLEITVEFASSPKKQDKRGRSWFRPNRKDEQAEIDEMHARGLHYVGDWHSHPADLPTPSARDISSIGETVRKSEHDLDGFLLLILGRAPGMNGLHLSIHDGEQWTELRPSPAHPGSS